MNRSYLAQKHLSWILFTNIMPASCHACSGNFRECDPTILCAGYCDAAYHTKCSGLSSADRKALEANPKLLWVCPGCHNFAGASRTARGSRRAYCGISS
uniref:Putative secreted protein n=1 Tax=Anopheles triannulatus TaxID=58253 RepID=A0A2M4B5T4_9DIPT